MQIDVHSTDSVEWLCGGDTACNGTSIWCPSDSNASCTLIGDGFSDDMFSGVEVYVDELYEYGFMNITCLVNDTFNGCSSSTVDVHCEGDKNITEGNLLYDEGAYTCLSDGASRCCPFGKCTVFNDPEMGFDSDLLSTSEYLTTVELDIDDTAAGNDTFGLCEGDCDNDDDNCDDGLICFENSLKETEV